MILGPLTQENLFSGFANNKGADQPAHLRSLISTFVIHLLESIISKLAMSEISIFLLVSAAEQAGLNLILSETPKTVFLALRITLFQLYEFLKHVGPILPNGSNQFE